MRTDGDVIQQALNGKNIPLSKVMDYDKMNDFNAGLEDLGLKPLAKIVSYADAAHEPEWFTTAPAKALPIALKKANLDIF